MASASNTKQMIRFSSVSSSDEETDDTSRVGMLLDIDLLNCPICLEGFTVPIFQCDNGHLACSSCCSKLRNMCHSCRLRIGNIRCRAVEKMIESIVYRCRNFKYGCEEKLYSADLKTHEQKCFYFDLYHHFDLQCFCPLQNCYYQGKYKDLYHHFYSNHYVDDRPGDLYNNRFTFGKPYVVAMHISEKMCVLMETSHSLLFVVQFFDEPYGVCVTVKCIAPNTPLASEIGEFSYSLSMMYYGHALNSEFPKMKKIQEVSFENPKEDFMLCPAYFVRPTEERLKLTIVVNKKMS